MKEYIKDNLLLTKYASGDRRCEILNRIYDHLEYHGLTTKEAKNLIDEVIRENILELCKDYL